MAAGRVFAAAPSTYPSPWSPEHRKSNRKSKRTRMLREDREYDNLCGAILTNLTIVPREEAGNGGFPAGLYL